MSKGAYLTAGELRAAAWLIGLAGFLGTVFGTVLGLAIAWGLR